MSALEQALLVAVPVLVGSLGRIPVGALADRWGARRMFPAVALLTILPVLYLGHLADSLPGYLVGTPLRGATANSARGAESFVAEAITTSRTAGATGLLIARMDSAFYTGATITACPCNIVRFLHRVRRQA